MAAVAEDEGMRSASWWMGIVVMAAACQRQPAPVLEYGETVTYTSTANDSAPQPLPAAHAAGSVPEQPPAAAPAPPPTEPEAVPTSDAEWTTTVHTGDVRGVSSSSEPAEPAPAPVDDAPPPPAAERPAPRQWYKAKPW